MQKTKLTYKDIFVELPIIIHNSHLLTSFMHQLPSTIDQADLDLPTSLSELNAKAPKLGFYPSLDSLDLSIDPFLEKNCDLLLESIETHYTELNNFQYHQRQLAREQVRFIFAIPEDWY
jgi:translation initiation factor 3 subunit H